MSAEGEITIWQGNPSWKSMLVFYVKWILVSLLAVGAWAALTAGGQDVDATWFTVVTGVGLIVTCVVGWIRRRTTRYLVTDRRIHIRTGLVSRHERTTHVDRIQNVNLRQGILQRLLGIGDVDWDTAGTDASDADFTFRGVDDPSALVRAADRYYGVAAVHETAQREL
jgi:uncharacterized membrane protein YdbT with pleckstrin-like domain